MVRKIIGVLCLIIAAGGLIGTITGDGEGTAEMVVLVCIFAALGLFLFLKKGKTKEQKAEQKAKKQAVKEKQSRTFPCEHMAGLPLAQGSACIIVFNDDGISIDGGGNTFRVAFDKVTDLQIKTDVDIQKSYVSSIGGAVGGAVLFGPLGAIVGGRAKEKKTKTVEYYLIITYNKDGAVDYLSFHIYDYPKAERLVRGCKVKLTTTSTTVDL